MCSVTNQLVHCSPFSYSIHEGVDKLRIRRHAVNIADLAFHTSVELCASGTIIDSRNVDKDGIGRDGLISPRDIQSRKRGTVGVEDMACDPPRLGELSGSFERFLDSLDRDTEEVVGIFVKRSAARFLRARSRHIHFRHPLGTLRG